MRAALAALGLALLTLAVYGQTLRHDFLRYDDLAATVHATLLARPGVINVASPIDSLLLSKPMYEVPPNHPNATWLDDQNPSYQTVLLWITAGAPL